MLDNAARFTAIRGDVQRKVDEICRFILDGENNLTQHLVKGYRAGLSAEAAAKVFDGIESCLQDARETYRAAIAQPEPKIRSAPRVNLASLATEPEPRNK